MGRPQADPRPHDHDELGAHVSAAGGVHLAPARAAETEADRHQAIGEGTLGTEPFRRIMNDERLRAVPKVLETPKGDDDVSADRANLALLRGLRSG
jgi:endonuclease IV